LEGTADDLAAVNTQGTSPRYPSGDRADDVLPICLLLLLVVVLLLLLLLVG
jgi:hypothetical protein